MTTQLSLKRIVHILRNPYGLGDELLRQARNEAATFIDAFIVAEAPNNNLEHAVLALIEDDIARNGPIRQLLTKVVG